MSQVVNKFIQHPIADQTGQAGNFLTTNGTVTSWSSVSPGSPEIAIFNETQTSGTNGGTFTSGAWVQRVLNTTVQSQAWASLSSNQVTLSAGTYLIEATCPGVEVGSHKAKLKNVSGSSDAIIGESAFAGTGAGTNSVILGIISPGSSIIYELQHQCQTTVSGGGLGLASGFGVDEIYCQLKITKL